MTFKRIDQTPCHDALLEQVRDMADPTRHLKLLLKDPKRRIDFSTRGGGLYLDYTRQRLTRTIRDLLIDAAQRLQLPQRFEEMCRGK